MTVAGEAELEGEATDVLLAFSQTFHRRGQTQPNQILVHRDSRLLAEHPSQMERRAIHSSRQIRE
jgi:hypothetical protein